MTQIFAHNRQKGFTLVETIIYIGLFGILFTGIFVSVYPLFTGAERLSENILIEGETAFILTKIRHALSHTMISPEGEIISPAEGAGESELVMEFDGTPFYRFAESESFCGGPSVCKVLTLEADLDLNGALDDPLPLNATRIDVTDFEVTHVGPNGNTPRYIDVSFKVNGAEVGPVRYYVHF